MMTKRMMVQSVSEAFFSFNKTFPFAHLSEIFAEESDIEEESGNEHVDEYDDEEDISEELDENEEMDDDGGESEISSDEDDENLIHTNGIKKFDAHLGMHRSNADLLNIDGPPSDAYLQTMNDNLHKKFRRSNNPFGSLHSTDREFLHPNNNNNNPSHHQHHLGQLNGDYKNNINYSTMGNGQGEAKKDNADDDDDDIVLVSDDDSEEKKPEAKTNSKLISLIISLLKFFLLDIPTSEVITYAPDVATTYVETVSVKTTTLIFNNDGYAKDLLEDIDRVCYC